MDGKNDIKWIPKKTINHSLTSTLLKESEGLGQYTNGGPNVKRLEEWVKNHLRVDSGKAVVCVTNGTVALHALVAAIHLGESKNLQWATQAFTFPSSVQGNLAGTHIVDIDAGGGLDLKQVPEDADGIIVTNVFGNVVDISKYEEWAARNNKILLFDNAATAYTFYKRKNAVNYGTGCIISFHHTKPIGFGEGGAIIVDAKYEHHIRHIINFGINNGVTATNWHPMGSNYKMSDIAAVYILQFLSDFSDIVERTRTIYALYKSLLEGVNGVDLYPNFADPDTIPFVSCMCVLSNRYTPECVQEILTTGVFCRKYYNPLISLPKSDEFFNKILCVPCHYDMDVKDVIRVTTQLL